MSVKQFVGCVFVGAAASFSFIGLAHAQTAATVTVDNSVQAVQTPATASTAGIAYSQSGTGSLLKVYTSGFLFCGNPTTPASNLVTLQAAHEDQSFTPAHPWTFATATDVSNVSYAGNALNVNRTAIGAVWTSLVCNSVGAAGDMVSGVADGIFVSGFDSVTETNYSNMVNWTPDPQLGFQWSQPDWSEVPVNACISTTAQPMAVVEDTACAAVTGVRPDATQPTSNERAGSMWTNSTESSKFTYAFRVDVRAGAQQASQSPTQISLPAQFSAPSATTNGGATTSDTVGVNVTVIDAYDSTYLKGTGTYCVLTQLPATLSSSVCTGQTTTKPLSNGPLSLSFPTTPPPFSSGISSFYIAVVRDINGSHPSDTTPVVGASILVDSAILTLSGDQFVGDDVVFGFMTGATTASGFPWMQEP